MRHALLLTLLSFAVPCSQLGAAAESNFSPVDLVNIFMGTNNEDARFSRGNQYPGVHTPFGMNAWSAASRDPDNPWFYQYTENTFTGIKLTHQPSVWARDHGSMVVMPMTGKLKNDPKSWFSQVKKSNETATPYYYGHFLEAYDTAIEFVPTDRAAFFRYTFPQTEKAYVVFDAKSSPDGSIFQVSEQVLSGFTENNGVKLFFSIEFDHPVVLEKRGEILGAARLKISKQHQVQMKIGTSYISIDQARSNALVEIGDKTFEALTQEIKQRWNTVLSRVEVKGGTEENRRTFYSALYRTHAFPKIFWEHQGENTSLFQYRSPYDGKVHKGRKLWAGNGFWDTYRAVWPFFTILYPDMVGEMLDGWVNSYRDGGWTVRWSNPGYWECMISTHSDLIFADAYIKGIRNWDYHTGYEASLKNAMTKGGSRGKGRRFMERYTFLGYVPWTGLNIDDEVGARTVEHGINDFGLARWAQVMGRDLDHRYFLNRSRGYLHLWSPETQHFRVKDDRGRWRTSTAAYDPYAWRYGWTEGNAWHYRTAPMHDGHGLVSLFGGRKGLEQGIDEVLGASSRFEVGGYGRVIHEMLEAEVIGKKGFGQFALGNQPIQHMLHMYSFAGRPSKTQKWTRRALTELFSSGVGDGYGYPGDEDNGQTSVWYVMNAMGFYPASPGFPEYILTSPLFDEVKIHLSNSKTFVIKADGNDQENLYIQQAHLNGETYGKNYLNHQDILQGGVLKLQMGSEPSSWGERLEDAPSGITPPGVMPVYYPDLSRKEGGFASGENQPQEAVLAAFDDDATTKWLTFANQSYLGNDLGDNYLVNTYTLTSANDFPERDPKDWVMEASLDGENWQILDTQKQMNWQYRYQTKVFALKNQQPFRYYRLRVTANHGAAATQLGEMELIFLP